MVRAPVVLMALLLPALSSLTAAAGPTPHWKPLRPGVDYALLHYTVGPINVHVVRANLDHAGVSLTTLRSPRKRPPSHLVRDAVKAGTPIVAAINGDYFNFRDKLAIPWGMQVARGEIVHEPTGKSVLFLGPKGARIDRLTMKATLTSGGKSYPIARFNQPCTKDELVLHNGALTPDVQGARPAARSIARLSPALRVNGVAQGTVGPLATPRVPAGGAVLVGCGQAAAFLNEHVPAGAQVRIEVRVPEVTGALSEAIGGGPRVVRDGKAEIEMDQERLPRGTKFYIRPRHPRSAMCLAGPKGRTALLFYVEGRHEKSVGMRLDRMSEMMVELGCRDAMMFDGGGSATMVVGGRTKGNAGVRGVANILAVIAR